MAPREKAEPISNEDEELLWKRGILGDSNPEQLVNTLLYLNGVHFALRAADEHENLKVNCQFEVLYDSQVGLKYLKYQEMSSKCNQGGLTSRFNEPKKGRTYQNVVNPDRCLVRLFEKYMSHRPDHDPRCSRDFYLRPLSVPNGNVWYSCQPKGRHSIEKIVKEMCNKIGLTGRRTNHSLRASTATRLFEQGVDEQLICEKTGHRSVAVRGYKRTSSNQLNTLSNLLYGNVKENECKRAKTEPCATVSVPPPSDDKVITETKVSSNPNSNNDNKCVEVSPGMVVNINFNVKK